MTAEKIEIRKATALDVSLLVSLIRDSFRDVAERFALTPENCRKHPSNCADEWIENDHARGVTYYILESNGKPVGCVALERADNDLCYLERLAVLPRERRKGFGKTLVDHVFAETKALGARTISIGIIADDAELRRWYEKIGFVAGETKQFPHLPFLVTFLTYKL